MEFFRIKRDIPFMRHALAFNLVSFITFAAAVFFLFSRGLHFSIEFTGGSLIELRYAQSANLNETRAAIDTLKYGDVQVQNFGTSRDVLVRLPLRAGMKQGEVVQQVFSAVCKAQGGALVMKPSDKGDQQVCQAGSAEPVTLQRSEFVGPQVGDELAEHGALALGVTVLGIMIYLAFRFEWKFAVAGIVANLHDVVIILGFFAFFQWEFSLSVLAAVLAVLGYSVNESVVIFDRIRETFRKQRKMTTPQVIDHAITSTTSRTVITHMSTEMMVLAMLIFGGPTLHYFALALTIGILFGIYSSVLVACPVAMWLGVNRANLIGDVDKKEGDKKDDKNIEALNP